MLNAVTIKGFKCIEEADLSLRPLTILAGPNASGKSSFIQAILLAYSVCRQANQAYLKEVVKPYANFDDVYCRFVNAAAVEIRVEENGRTLALKLLKDQAIYDELDLEKGYEESFFLP